MKNMGLCNTVGIRLMNTFGIQMVQTRPFEEY